MSFFQKIGNALSRFMYGRNGVDQLGLTGLWTAIILVNQLQQMAGQFQQLMQ